MLRFLSVVSVTVFAAVTLQAANPSLASDITSLPYIGFDQDDISPQDYDAQEGLRSIFAGEDFHYGLPWKLYSRVADERGLNPEKNFRTFGTLPSPPGRPNSGRNVQLGESVFSRDGDSFVNGNCFTCHAGVVNGTVYSGVGNAHLDTTAIKALSEQLIAESRTAVGRLALLFLLSRNEQRVLRNYQDYLETILLPAVDAKTRGENHGPFVIWRMIARMIDPSQGLQIFAPGERSPYEHILDRQLPPVDPNPWWHFKYKKRAFWTQDVSHNSYATFALNLMDPHPDNTATFPERMERMRKQLAYVNQIETPVFPARSQVNRDLAARGRALFHGETALTDGSFLPCKSCHGTYDHSGELVRYPELAPIDWRVIGTDPAYASILHNDFKILYQRFQQSPFAPAGEDTVFYPEVVGYTPPPLKGIWASAPYFHNGSVPTVWHVLNSKQRPTYWLRSIEPDDYDRSRLGLVFRNLSEAAYLAAKQSAEDSGDALSDESLYLRRIYNTYEYGRTNMGHTFGDPMSDSERSAVIEYLKLL